MLMKFLTKKDLILPKRNPNSKKGDNGRVLVIAGSKEYVGAAALAGIAALRSGVDWVTVIAPEKVGWAINGMSVDLVVKKIKGDYFKTSHLSQLLKEEKHYDAVLIGNGITDKAAALAKNYIKKSTKPLVIDADAIKATSIRDCNHAIFTPHKKEFEILLKNSKIKNKAELKKNLRDNTIILKGKTDEIITKKETFHNRTGNPGMTKAGTGDVLAGLAAGFYAQTKDPLRAAKMAAYYNGLIGDILLKKKKGFTYLASDMVEEIKKLGK